MGDGINYKGGGLRDEEKGGRYMSTWRCLGVAAEEEIKQGISRRVILYRGSC